MKGEDIIGTLYTSTIAPSSDRLNCYLIAHTGMKKSWKMERDRLKRRRGSVGGKRADSLAANSLCYHAEQHGTLQ